MPKFFRLSKQSKAGRKPVANRAGSAKLMLLNIAVLSLLLVIGVGYLVEVSSTATKGYAIRELENKITALELQGNELKLQALALESIENVQAKVGELDMVAVGDLDYLNPTPVAVAR